MQESKTSWKTLKETLVLTRIRICPEPYKLEMFYIFWMFYLLLLHIGYSGYRASNPIGYQHEVDGSVASAKHSRTAYTGSIFISISICIIYIFAWLVLRSYVIILFIFRHVKMWLMWQCKMHCISSSPDLCISALRIMPTVKCLIS